MPGLDPFYATFNNPANIAMATLGDSTTEGDVVVTNGGWPEQLRLLAQSRWGRGGDGCHPMNRDPWSITNDWTSAAADGSSPWDRSIFNGGAGTPAPTTYFGNGSAMVATWTKPTGLAATSFTLYMVDGASAGNFSYSTDGGSTWLNVSATWNQDNSIKRIHINTAVASTVKIRAANAAGTAVNTYLVGLEPLTGASGFTIHNFAANIAFLSAMVRGGAGNWHALLDTIQPPLVTNMYTNDVVLFSAPLWQSDLEALGTVVTGYGGSVLFMSMFEQFGRDITIQATMRSIVKTVAAEFGMPVIDFYDLVGDANATLAAGYYNTNTDIHENNAGAVFMAQQIWKLIAKSGVGAKFRP